MGSLDITYLNNPLCIYPKAALYFSVTIYIQYFIVASGIQHNGLIIIYSVPSTRLTLYIVIPILLTTFLTLYFISPFLPSGGHQPCSVSVHLFRFIKQPL